MSKTTCKCELKFKNVSAFSPEGLLTYEKNPLKFKGAGFEFEKFEFQTFL